MKPRPIPIQFPSGGISEQQQYDDPRAKTTIDVLNMLPRDPATNRLRGAQRPGLSKFFPLQLTGGVDTVQRIVPITVQFDNCTFEQGTERVNEDFAVYATGSLHTDSNWETAYNQTQSTPWTVGMFASGQPQDGDGTDGAQVREVGGERFADRLNGSGHQSVGAAWADDTYTAGQRYSVEYDLVIASTDTAYLALGVKSPSDTTIGTSETHWKILIQRIDSDTVRTTIDAVSDGSSAQVSADDFDVDSDPQAGITVRCDVWGDTLVVHFNGERAYCIEEPGLILSGTHAGFFWDSTGMEVHAFRVYNLSRPQTGFEDKLTIVVNGSVYEGVASDQLSLASSGANALNPAAEVMAAIASVSSPNDTAPGIPYVYYADGRRYKRLNTSSAAMELWHAFNGDDAFTGDSIRGSMPYTAGATYAIIGIDTGAKEFTIDDDHTAEFTVGDAIYITGAVDDNNGDYEVTDVSLSSGDTVIEVAETIADNTTQGDVNTIAATCRFGTLYRGRIVLAGLESDPQNWFMSGVNDPRNWDYSPPTTSATQAVAGNNAEAGRAAQPITALAAYSDDVLIIGCVHSLWMMAGDPADGGIIENVSHSIGIVGPYAWAFDPNGLFYFVGTNGLYSMQPTLGSQPRLVSSEKLDTALRNVDLEKFQVSLVWDVRRIGLWVFIIPSGGGTSTTHYFYDKRTESFWPVQCPTDMVSSAGWHDGNVPGERAVLVGGFDGYVRSFDDDAENDDGTAIDAYVRMGLIPAGGPMQQHQLLDLQLTLGNDRDGATLDIYRGTTGEEAWEETTATFTKAQVAGRNLPIRKRIRAHAFSLRLRNNDLNGSFSYESGMAVITPVGRQRAGL